LQTVVIVAETPLENLATPSSWQYDYAKGYRHLGSGLAVGLSCLASGLAIGICGHAGVHGNKHRDILIALILMMIFAEAIALYGFIVGIVLAAG
jgi:V-type H+-transporting ATPase proteolipid subunit